MRDCRRTGWMGIAFLCVAASACDTPVHQYALDNWEAAPYEVYVFCHGALDSAGEAALARLKKSEGGPPPNIEVTLVNLDEPLSPEHQFFWERQQDAQALWMTVRYPMVPPQRPDVWSGPFTLENATLVASSPKRDEISKAIRQGHPAAWIFLESGTPDKDAAALAIVTETLKKDAEERSAAGPPVQESPVIRVSRNDPKEAFLVASLLGTESDLYGYDEPMAFPVFGRGRVLYAILGAGINESNVREACGYVFGACSCIVKDENPGMDLLVAAAWTDLDFTPRAGTVSAAATESVLPPALEKKLADAGGFPAAYLLLSLAVTFALVLCCTWLLMRHRTA